MTRKRYAWGGSGGLRGRAARLRRATRNGRKQKMRYLKAVGLAALAALMASAMFASAASAQAGILKSGDTETGTEPADITAVQYDGLPETLNDWNYLISTPGTPISEAVTCDNAVLSATSDGEETDLTVEAEYNECEAEGRAATVTMNDCDYILKQPTTEEGLGAGEYTGKAALTCPEDKKIQIHFYLFGNSTAGTHSFNVCTVEVYPHDEPPHREQELGGHVIYDNTTSPNGKDDITAAVNLNEITVDDNCSGEHHETEGIYKQTLTVEAFDHEGAHNENEQLDLWLEH
jgi:hypothetical protein